MKIMQRMRRGTKLEVITDNKEKEETKKQDAEEEVELRRIR